MKIVLYLRKNLKFVHKWGGDPHKENMLVGSVRGEILKMAFKIVPFAYPTGKNWRPHP